MKILSRIITILFTAALLVPPSFYVQAAPLSVEAPADSTWHCVGVMVGTTGRNDLCPEDSNPLVLSGSEGDSVQMDGKIICTLEGCSTDIVVYVSVSFHLVWTSQFSQPEGKPVTVRAMGYNEVTQTVPCGTGTSGECEASVFLKVQSKSADPNYSWHAQALIGFGMAGGDTATLDYSISISGLPTNCDDNYQVMECLANKAEIDPTSETGLSYVIEQGKEYRMKLSGAWQAEEAGPDLTDVEISFDGGATWQTPDELMIGIITCVQYDPETTDIIIYFTAPSNSFKIRVKDTPGQYADNTGGMLLDLCEALRITQSNCSQQFQVATGSPLAAITVQATNSNGAQPINGNTPVELEVGEWYAVTTSGGPWYDIGGGTAKYDMEIKTDGSNFWSDLPDYSMSNCSKDTGNYTTMYFQAAATSVWLRVNTADNNWTNNSGSMTYTLYGADYTRFPETCEATFENGDYVDGGTVGGAQENGVPISDPRFDTLTPEQGRLLTFWYAFETLDGPWLNSQTPDYSTDLRLDPATYTPTEDYPDAACVVQTDMLGHYLVYMQGGMDDTWYYRVHDTTFGDNGGSMGWSLVRSTNYDVDNGGEYPPSGACDSLGFTSAGPESSITFQATNSTGVFVPLITAGNWYAIETTDGPWQEDGVTPSYNVELSDDGGLTWTLIYNHPAISCSSDLDGNHTVSYLKAQLGHDYKVRVEGDPTWTTNTGFMGVTVYEVSTGDVNPWNSCADDYTLTEYNLQNPNNVINANLEEGRMLPTLVPGETYAVEISGGPWTNQDGAQSYLADIQIGSASWEPMSTASAAICRVLVDPVLDKWRVYFTATAAMTNWLRVGDTDADWSDNTGTLVYRLYGADPTGEPPPGGDDGDTGDGTGVTVTAACGRVCYAPGLFTNVTLGQGATDAITGAQNILTPIFTVINGIAVFLGLDPVEFETNTAANISIPVPNVLGAADYARCVFTSFIAWCPEHTSMLLTMGNVLNNKDPIGLFNDFTSLKTYMNDEINSYNWDAQTQSTALTRIAVTPSTDPDSVGEEIWAFLFPNPSLANPWDGVSGALVWDPDTSWATLRTCNLPIASLLPETLSTYFCVSYNFVFSTPIGGYILLIVSVLLVIGFVVYLFKYPSRFMDAVEGHLFRGSSVVKETGNEVKRVARIARGGKK
jgi:hypothetical protein